jgi:hypothetical protein
VPKGATLDMNPNVTEVTVVTPDGKKIALSVDPTEPISAIKDKLQFWEGVLPEEQRLVYNGQPLADGITNTKRHFFLCVFYTSISSRILFF